MADQSPRGCVDSLLRGAFALLAVAVAVNVIVSVIRCNWAWIVGAIILAAVVAGVVWWLRNRRDGW